MKKEKSPVIVNPVVDPSAALTDPMNTNFRPQNKKELKAAVDAQLDTTTHLFPDEALEKIKKALQPGESMNTEKGLEETIRRQVRSIIKEITLAQLPPSLRKLYLDAGAPATGQIPPDVLNKISARPETVRNKKLTPKQIAAMAGAEQWAKPVSGELPPVRRGSETSFMGKFEKDPALGATLEKMLPDVQVSTETAKQLSTVAKKVADAIEPLYVATLKKIAGMLKKIVDDYNSGLSKDEKFNLKDMKTDGDIVKQYANFLEFVGADDSSVSEADFEKIQPALESLHTAMMDPYQLLWQKEKLSQMKVADQALRGWMNNAAREIKDEPALQSGEAGRSRINLSQEFFSKVFKQHLSSLKIDNETIAEMCDDLVAAFRDESPANMTNIMSQKLIQTAFLNLWEKDFIEPFGIGDLFTEKESGRHAEMTRGFEKLAKSSPQQQGISEVENINTLKQLVSNFYAAMRSESDNEEEYEKILVGDLNSKQIMAAKKFIFDPRNEKMLATIIEAEPAFEDEIYSVNDVINALKDINI